MSQPAPVPAQPEKSAKGPRIVPAQQPRPSAPTQGGTGLSFPFPFPPQDDEVSPKRPEK